MIEIIKVCTVALEREGEKRRDKRRSEISNKEGLRYNSYCELKHLLIFLFLFVLISTYLPPKISKFFYITSKKTDETVPMVCKVFSMKSSKYKRR